MSEQTHSSLSLPLRILFQTVLTIALVWLLNELIPQYFSVKGGLAAFVIIGCLMTLMNMIVRPILHILTLPLKLFATIIAIILANAVFLWMVMWVTDRMDPTLIQFQVRGGIWGWLVVSLFLGIMNWILKELLHKHE